MDVARREQLLVALGQPAVARSRLTFWAVPIAAAVVRDGAMSTAGALIDMAAECGGATGSNGPQHFDVFPADPLAASFNKCFSCGADQIGHLEGWPVHLLALCRLVLKLQQFQRTGGGMEALLGEMQVDGGLFQ